MWFTTKDILKNVSFVLSADLLFFPWSFLYCSVVHRASAHALCGYTVHKRLFLVCLLML